MVNYYVWGAGILFLLGFFIYNKFFNFSKSFKIQIWDLVKDEIVPREKYTYPIFKNIDDTTKMIIKSEKETFDLDKMLKPPAYSELKFNSNGEKVYHLAKLKTGSFAPIEKFSQDGKVKIVDAEDDFWKTLNQKQLRERHKDETKWYEKPIFTIAVVGIICLLLVYATVKNASRLVADSSKDLLQMQQGLESEMGLFRSAVEKLTLGKTTVEEANIPVPPE